MKIMFGEKVAISPFEKVDIEFVKEIYNDNKDFIIDIYEANPDNFIAKIDRENTWVALLKQGNIIKLGIVTAVVWQNKCRLCPMFPVRYIKGLTSYIKDGKLPYIQDILNSITTYYLSKDNINRVDIIINSKEKRLSGVLKNLGYSKEGKVINYTMDKDKPISINLYAKVK